MDENKEKSKSLNEILQQQEMKDDQRKLTYAIKCLHCFIESEQTRKSNGKSN